MESELVRQAEVLFGEAMTHRLQERAADPDQTTAGSNFGGAFPYNFAHALGINGAYYYATLSVGFGR